MGKAVLMECNFQYEKVAGNPEKDSVRVTSAVTKKRAKEGMELEYGALESSLSRVASTETRMEQGDSIAGVLELEQSWCVQGHQRPVWLEWRI